MEKDIVIISAVQTPFGRYCGSLRDFDYFNLGAIPMREALKKVNLEPELVDEVFWGVGDTSPCKDVYTPVAARQTLLKAGLSSVWNRGTLFLANLGVVPKPFTTCLVSN